MIPEDFYHRLLYALARQAKLHCRPNPAVAAALFHKNHCVSWGITQPVGREHAEIAALNMLKKRLGERHFHSMLRNKNQTRLMVSLSPCHFKGRTAACSKNLAALGLREIVVAHDDSHPLVQKKSLNYLKKQGFVVKDSFSLELKKKFLWLNYDYLLQRSPTFTLKYAMTADGKMALHSPDERWITGVRARKDARYERAVHDAVFIGAGTFFADNPRLDLRDFSDRKSLDWEMIVRDAEISPDFIKNAFFDEKDALVQAIKCFFYDNSQEKNAFLSNFSPNSADSIVYPPQKIFRRIIFFSRDIVPAEEKKLAESALLQKKNREGAPVIFLTGENHARLNRWVKKNLFEKKDFCCKHYSPTILEDVSLQKKFFTDFCREYEIDSLFVEGGSRMLAMFLEAGLCDRLLVYLAPKLLADGAGGLSPFFQQQHRKNNTRRAVELQLLDFSRIDQDIKLGYVPKNAEYKKLSRLFSL